MGDFRNNCRRRHDSDYYERRDFEVGFNKCIDFNYAKTERQNIIKVTDENT
jgi:hypothetical protein